MRIKDLPKVDRPREKLLHYGPEKLATHELLAIILGTGKKGQNVLQLSKKIIKHIKVDNLSHVSIKDLQSIYGMGISKASSIVASFELGKRLLNGKKHSLLMSPKDVWEEMKDIRNIKKEQFVVFYLDIRNQVIQRDIISVGILDASLVHPREVFEPAIRASAAQIIISHNHPSGIVEPSQEDIMVTKRLIEAGKILGIELVDHIIVSKDSYLSLKEQESM